MNNVTPIKSARRLIDLPVHDTMTGDHLNLHRAVSQQALEDAAQMEAIRKMREDEMPIQYADDFETNPWWPRAIVVLLLLAIACIAMAPEIAGFLSFATH
jgi:hypothetical protein